MSNLHIVAADGIGGSGLDLLKNHFGADAVEVRGKYSEEELISCIPNIDALLIRSGTTVTRKALDAAGDRLKIIGRAGVGTDNIDKAAATERGIIVMNTPLGNIISAAEQAIALLFATARNIARADKLMQEGKWEKKALVGVEVQNKKLGLIGLGKVGGHVAKVMRAAGMEVLAYDPYLPPESAKKMGVTLCELDDIFANSDFISLHTPLTDSTKNLLNTETLKKTKPGVRIVNCARGGIVDEEAFAEMVKSGHIVAAGFDVFANEPATEGSLFGLKDVTLTPHLGASTEEAGERVGVQIAEQVISYYKNGEIINAVNVSHASDPDLKPYVEVAQRCGHLATSLLDTAVEQIEVTCSGDIAERDTGEVVASAVQGALRASGLEGVNVINAEYLAKERGIKITESSGEILDTFRNRVDIVARGGDNNVEISGTAYDGVNPRIVKINGFQVDLRLNPHMVIMQYPDRPGYVGRFGTIMANHNINIADMEVGRVEKEGNALTAFGLDEAPNDEVMNEVRALEGVATAHFVNFG